MTGNDAVFLDTSGWIASLDSDDQWHTRAVDEYGRLGSAGRPFVTTDWVIAETGNGLARVKVRQRFPDVIARFLASPNCRLIRVGEELFQQALSLYHRSDDKSWGLVDCASFVVMGREHIMDALHHRYSFPPSRIPAAVDGATPLIGYWTADAPAGTSAIHPPTFQVLGWQLNCHPNEDSNTPVICASARHKPTSQSDRRPAGPAWTARAPRRRRG